ncbi:hypothetical protein FOB41_15205 [Agrobacterium pusense]|uniref:Uncharacterized protein n=1 Tax=Agrobacterium pusense TaxID=648995 RepID=A0A6H0ZQN2_9HYPH|nr:hypothetical protein [Agrobacterium pusense]QIX22397.1 hypothetical protein FOB41_15205 [Agrobacterium pusense]
MTTKIPEDVVSTLYSKPHRAVHLIVTSKLGFTDGAKVSNAVSDYLAETPDKAEMLPVWLRFTDLQDCEIYALQPYFVPADKDFLSGLILAVDGVEKHMTVSNFDYRVRQFPKKREEAGRDRRSTGTEGERKSTRKWSGHHAPRSQPPSAVAAVLRLG